MKIERSLAKLLEISSAPLSKEVSFSGSWASSDTGTPYEELSHVLRHRNGFYAFESALHVFPSTSSPDSVGLEEWNSPAGWRTEYGDLADSCLFFAEDVFGGQFCLKHAQVWQFDPETGGLSLLGDSLEEWAQAVLSDFEYLTGHPLAKEWQLVNGPIPARMRLVPKVPFVLGGEFSISNMTLMNAEKGMRARGSLAVQLRELPDGAQVHFALHDGN